MHETFKRFNHEIFNDKLKCPQFELANARTFLGKFKAKKSNPAGRNKDIAIVLSVAFNVDEKLLEDVLIHEMIHYEIFHDKIKDTSAHGDAFQARMNQINKDFGRNISTAHKINEINGVCNKPRQERNPVCVVAVITFTDGKVGFKVLPPTRLSIQKYNNGLKKAINIAKTEYYITAHEAFAPYPRSAAMKYFLIDDKIKAALKSAKKING